MALVKPGEKNYFQRNKRRLPPIESIGIKIRVLGISLSNDLKVGKVKVSVPFKFDVNLIFILQSTNSSQFRNVTFVTFSQKNYHSNPLTNLSFRKKYSSFTNFSQNDNIL